jgi:hypothetical protein
LSARIRFCLALGSRGQPLLVAWERGGGWVLQEAQDREEIIERVAALDIGKAEVVCCVRVPREGRRGGGCRRCGLIPR